MDTEKVFAVIENTGAHEPAPVWSLSTTREKAEADIEELSKSQDRDRVHFEVVEVVLDKLLDSWFNG